jgi:SpoVK/Ycf46/Vps4 family AAA+-type ATPase
VIFVDEIDSFLSMNGDASSARLAIQFLGHWDRAKSLGLDILVVGATNFPQFMDKLLTSRFTLQFFAGPPVTDAERAAVFNTVSDSISAFEQALIFLQHFEEVVNKGHWNSFITHDDMMKLGNLTHGYSNAEMTAICQKTVAVAGYSINDILLERNRTKSIQVC